MFSCTVGREEHCKQISLACVGSARSVRTTLGLPLLTARVLSQSTLLRLQVALPGTEPLRFRFLSTPQRRRLSWACVLCPSHVQAAQVTRCLASSVTPGGRCILLPPQSQPLSFLGVQWARLLRCPVCLFWGADLWMQPSQQMSTIQNPRSLG